MDGSVPPQPVTIKKSPQNRSDFLPCRCQKRGDDAGKTKKREKGEGKKREDHEKR